MNNKCEGCELYENGYCTKRRKNGTANPSTRDWLSRDKYDEPLNFISVERMCCQSSIFGNEYIGLTQSDIDRIKNGEIIHIPGEYGTFIGFINGDNNNNPK